MPKSNLEILAYEDTPLGTLCLRRRELLARPGTVVTEVVLNHEFLMSSHNTASERALARLALEMHEGDDLRVLVGGLGLGYTAHEALASSRVADVEVVELFSEVIGWLARDLVPLAAELKADERMRTEIGDIFTWLSAPATDRYDLVLIDVDHAPDNPLSHANDAFYSRGGLERAREHLAPDGILAVWSSAENPRFARALSEVYDEVRVAPVTFYNDLVDEETTDFIFLAR